MKFLITGKTGSGKTTLAQKLVETLGADKAEYITGTTAQEIVGLAAASTKQHQVIDFKGASAADRELIAADKLIFLDTVQVDEPFDELTVETTAHYMSVKDADHWASHIVGVVEFQAKEKIRREKMERGEPLLPEDMM